MLICNEPSPHPEKKDSICYELKVKGDKHCLFVATLAQSCPSLCDPMDCRSPGSSVHGDSPGKNTGVGCHALLQGHLPNSGIEPRFPALQVDSLPSEPPGKPPSHFKPMLFTNQKH